MRVLYVSSEVFPYAKTGGLADVSRSLPQALANLGHDVRVIMPRYRDIDEKYTQQMEPISEFTVELEWRRQISTIKKIVNPISAEEDLEYTTYFVENSYYFDRSGLYNHYDDAERFAFFCKAILEMLPIIGFKPDVIHCNDWQTAPICMLLKEKYRQDDFYKEIKSIFTIHNLQYQGNFPRNILNLLGFDEKYFRSDSIEFYGNVNFIKAGLVYGDILNTVSNTYSNEIQTPEYGCGLEGLIVKRKEALHGIINGIDYHIYNPKTDPSIYYNYDINSLSGKQTNKRRLLEELNLIDENNLVISMITRIVDQKGFQLLEEALHEIMQQDITLIVMGSGDPIYEEVLRNMENKFKNRVRIISQYENNLAHKIYAGSDVCLVPSRFEPCGLTQIIAMRYGTIPIVRRTGGLADTVKDFQITSPDGNGFIFDRYESGEMLKAIEKAQHFYRNPTIWERIIENAMSKDYSWEESAKKYEHLYESVIAH